MKIDQLRKEVQLFEVTKRTVTEDHKKIRSEVELIKNKVSSNIQHFRTYKMVGKVCSNIGDIVLGLAHENTRLHKLMTASDKLKLGTLAFPLTSPAPFPYCRDHPQYKGNPSYTEQPPCPQPTCKSMDAQDFLSPITQPKVVRHDPRLLHVEIPDGVNIPDELRLIKVIPPEPENNLKTT